MSVVSEMLPEMGEEKPQKPLFGLTFLQHLSEASLLRQLGLLVGLSASVAIGLALVLWSQQAQYRPLLASLAGVNAEQVSETLGNAGIDFHLEPDSGALLVKSEDLARARLALAKANIAPQDASIGFELLDREQGLGSSQFMEQTNYRRGLEGELARTIAAVNGVKQARVHLGIPKTAVFVRDARKPSASVLVELYPGRSLEAGQVLAIVNLVAASVPEMESAQVAVVDNKGRLLSDQQELSELTQAGKQLDYTRKLESTLQQRLDNLLAPVLGMERFQAQVTADIDFSAQELTSETFNPTAPALRSEQKVSEQRQSSQPPQGVPGALSNQPPAEGRAPQQATATATTAGGPIAAGQPLVDAYGEQIKDPQSGQPMLAPFPADTREQATRNFELDRKIQHSKQPVGQLKRLSVALVVDHQMKANAEGELVATPWTSQELSQLTELVQSAVGFDAARGDQVQVINAPFNAMAEEPLPEIAFYQQPWFWQLGKPALALLVLLILIFGLLRPLLKPAGSSKALALLDNQSEPLEGELPEAEPLALPSPKAEKPLRLPGATEGFNAQLDAIRDLVADDPGRVAQVVKLWMNP
ncbi:flagellar M-ring protein FliF [Ventosimonas gracilis]|uniref:Flagellar M-ring protein n=1 Tax=Ventosimonas gracilis TaxID=1680762 RepID=A0A139SX24_9GAMM|nr:flagellar basal-body MS-ring/collar protein FliF [Ventosimonas gracilis]KXU38941.1 flagellar M-ring protein FliF [Ventosimonas gracilis]